MRRSHFGYERQSQRRDKQFGNRKNEVQTNHNPWGHTNRTDFSGTHSAQHILIGQSKWEYHQEYVRQCCNSHTDSNLHRSRRLFAGLLQRAEQPHDKRSEEYNKERVHTLEYFCPLDTGKAKVDIYYAQIYIVTCKICQRITILMEWQPEKDYHTEYSKQCIDTLFDFSSTHFDFFLTYSSILLFSCCNLLCRIGETFFISQIDYQWNQHSDNRSHESVLETTIKHIQIVVDKCAHISHMATVKRNFFCQRCEILHCLRSHFITFFKELVAKFGQGGIIIEVVHFQPPVTHTDSNPWSKEATDIDKHIENLKTGVTQARVLRIIIHLTYQCLKISFEQTVTERNDQKSKASQSEIKSHAGNRCGSGNGNNKITDSHHH